MADCTSCGARISPGEHFCGNCGTQQIPISPELKTIAADISDDLEVQPERAPLAAPAVAEPAGTVEPPAEAVAIAEPAPISSDSLGGSFTDNVHMSETTATPRGTGGRRP